ncbi:MAG: D-glycero-beta-D-manno-heptose-7-phosphate kinase [Flavobacteriales bacterium]|nr:D-glycero-beta-D-manno-heptose-7-phosphate kinase [Flavobacteriales bacterium]|tara:strand:+ start:35519 stop:36502 length:984 start_codon:yes stop_codon:yes gene_type:complete
MINFKKVFSEFNNKKVLIIGDAMIDAYMWGEINRMSPEAPVPIVEIQKHETRLGGAANVALNIQSLEAKPILCSVIGDDIHGNLFLDLMHKSNLSTEGILISKKRRTTLKTRVIANEKHQLRVDEEDTKPIQLENKFINKIKDHISSCDVVILQDYNKGTLTQNVIKEIIATANKLNIPTIVDPKKINFNNYNNCTIFKPNLSEIKEGMKIDFNSNNQNEINEVTNKLLNKLQAKAILLTMSEQGISITYNKEFEYTPAFQRKIIDVSGAGDTVISVASLCLTTEMNFKILSKLSSLAGGIVCEEVGVVPINKNKLLSEAAIFINYE